MNHKTDVLGLQVFLREKFNLWAGNGSCVELQRYNFRGYQMYVPQKILSKNPEP